MPKQKKHIRKYKTPEGKTRYVYPKDRSNNYLSTLAKVAPVFGAKALLGDLPRGAIEQAAELKLRGSKDSFVDSVKRGLKGRGGGRAMGAGLGILTAPIFLKGVELASSKNKEDQKKGLAYIGLSTAAYQLPKGGLEGYRASRSVGDSVAKALRKGGILGLTRSGYKLPAAAALGLSIAAGRKKGKSDKDPSFAQKMVIPALTGAAIGAGSRSFENIVEQLSEGRPKNKAQVVKVLKKALPSAGGGAIGGLLGGVILSAAVEGATKALKKKEASATLLTKEAASIPVKLLEAAATHAAFAGGMGYKTKPLKALGIDADLAKLTPKGVRNFVSDAQSTQMAIGIKEGLAGRKDAGIRSDFLLTMTMPELKIPREAGMALGRSLRNVPADKRESTLRAIKRYVNNNPELKTNPRTGEPTPVFRSLSDGIDKAVGKKELFKKSKHFPTFQKYFRKALHGKRGALSKGLPEAGKPDKGGKLKSKLVPAASLAAGLTLPVPVLNTHLLIGGLKTILPSIPLVGPALSDTGMAFARRGIIQGLLPGTKTSVPTKAFDALAKYVVSPASQDISRAAESAAAHVRKKMILPALAKGVDVAAEKAILPGRKRLKRRATKGLLAGAGGAGALAALDMGLNKKR